MRVPVDQPYTITTQFGVPDSNALYGKHSGIDYAVPLNRSVHAPTSGQLTNIVSPTGGNMVKIFDGEYYHRLMHNNYFSRSDGPVNEGDEVAKAGTTGLSTGVHCHWDIATQNIPSSFSVFINPNEWLKGEDMPTMIPDERSARALLYLNGWTDQDIKNTNVIKEMVGQDYVGYIDRLKLAPDSNPFKHNIAKVQSYDNDVNKQYVPVSEQLYREKK